MNDFKIKKLGEQEPERYAQFKEGVDRILANKGLKSYMASTLDGVEERTRQAEASYALQKTQYERLLTLRTEYYDKKEFNDQDPRYKEMGELGDIKERMDHTKILQNDVQNLTVETRDVLKGSSEIEEIIQDTVSDHLFRKFNAEIKKHPDDKIKGLKAGLKAIKDTMTGDPEAVISEMKGAIYKDRQEILDCTTLMKIVSDIEGHKMKIEEAASDMGIANDTKDKTYLKAVESKFKEATEQVKGKLPNEVKDILEKIKTTKDKFDELAKKLRDATSKHIGDEKKNKKKQEQKGETTTKGHHNSEPGTAFNATKRSKDRANNSEQQVCNNMRNYGQCRFGNSCDYSHNTGGSSTGDRHESMDRHQKSSNRDRSNSRGRSNSRDRSDRDRDRSRSRDRNDLRGRERERSRSNSNDTLKNVPAKSAEGRANKGGGGRGTSSSSKN